jgi:hypothetical protein
MFISFNILFIFYILLTQIPFKNKKCCKEAYNWIQLNHQEISSKGNTNKYYKIQDVTGCPVAMLHVYSYVPLVPFSMQSIPRAGLFSFTWRAFTSVNVWIGDRPEFSARANGMLSSASEKARKAYCSRDEIWQIHGYGVYFLLRSNQLI